MEENLRQTGECNCCGDIKELILENACVFCHGQFCNDCLLHVGSKNICKNCVAALRQVTLPELKIFSGRSNPTLAENICACLGMPLGRMKFTDFEGTELKPQFAESIRGKDVFIMQSMDTPRYREEMYLMLDAARRASAEDITAVIPCFGYQRQERKTEPRTPISAKLFSDFLVASGAKRLVLVDLHADAIQGFTNLPTDHLWATAILLKQAFSDLIEPGKSVFVTDLGRSKIVNKYARDSRVAVAFAYKQGRESGADFIEEVRLNGDVRGKICIILDDIVKTAGTMDEIAKACLADGAVEVYGGGIHGELPGRAIDKIAKSCLKWLAVTDSVEVPKEKRISKIRVVSIAKLLADAIYQIHIKGSVSSLFD